jgi:predicted RNase H-like HicB family nuclease
MSEHSLHVQVHYGRDGYWAKVKEWPGCFATGRTLSELTEALEESIGLYMTPDDQEEPIQGALRIREMELELDADRPLIRARAESADGPLRPPLRSRDPHPDWPLREFHRREEE